MTSASDQVELDLSEENGKKYPCILIFGPPGAGKGTISALLAQIGHLYHLSSGDIFRGMSPNSPMGKLTSSYSSKGLYVPDDVTIEIWHHFVKGLIATNRYKPDEQLLLLDGVPRTQTQAEVIDQYVDVRAVISLQIKDENVLIQRLKGRAQKQGRIDDMDDEILRTRMQVYRDQTAGILNHYPKESIVTVNADQAVPQVLRDVLGAVADRLILA